MKNKVAFMTLFLMSLSTLVFSQSTNKVGISGTVQSSQFGVSVPIWMGERFALVPSFDFKYAEKIGTDFGISIAPRHYFRKETVSPYLGALLGTLMNIASSDNEIDSETTIDIIGGVAFGGEYFLSDNFSFGVELQGNITISDENSNRFGNAGGINFNTATMISATIYF